MLFGIETTPAAETVALVVKPNVEIPDTFNDPPAPRLLVLMVVAKISAFTVPFVPEYCPIVLTDASVKYLNVLSYAS